MRGYSPQCFRAITAIVTAAGVLASPIAPILIAHRGSPQASSAPQAATPQPGDGGWPRDFVSAAGATMRVYQPQIASWDGQKRMVAFSAVSYSPKGSTKQPTLGTIKIEADTSTAVDERLVSFSQIKLTETHFPNLSNDEVRDAVARVSVRAGVADTHPVASQFGRRPRPHGVHPAACGPTA